MPRGIRSAQKNCKPCPPTEIEHKPTSYRGVDWPLQEDLCIDCPCCGLRVSTRVKVEGSDPPEYIPRFTGEPYDVKLYRKTFGGKTPAPAGTLHGHGRKAAKGVIIYTDVTGSEPGILADVLDKIKAAQEAPVESKRIDKTLSEFKPKPVRKQSKKAEAAELEKELSKILPAEIPKAKKKVKK